MSTKQKLELNWIGKHKRPRLEPRILLEDKALSYGDADSENLLIHGDNLLALKALEQKYAGKVKCILIDPPYNTGNAFSHYDDGLEHSIWLSLMRDRLELFCNLLSDDGVLWICIDDDECHYLKVLCDEIFGRQNFVSNVIWQKKYSPQNDAKWLSDNHDHILLYAKNKVKWRPNLLPRTEEADKRYKNPDNDSRGPWKPADLSVRTYNELCDYEIITPSGRVVKPAESRCWGVNKKRFDELVLDNRIWFGESGNNVPAVKKFLSEVKAGTTAMTIWTYQEVGHNQDAKKEVKLFNSKDVFDTPKPEKLIQRIIQLSTSEGDLVLDSFAGSGTTGAVAHKMERRWIMIELGDHCRTHIVPRLKKVINGEDQGGITKSVNWQGGGGFRYLSLAPSLLKKDHWGNWIINKEYNAEMLAEAMCKHMNFTYAPSQTQYWNHGYSTETDYIYVTTGSLAYEQLKVLSEEVGTERTLLICCKAFMTEGADFPNLTLVKIPRAILSKCEWDHDDYSFTLNVLSDSEQPDDIDYDENIEDEESL
ncbi:site-specific DNA-methyltransferase [Salmonella enterica]|nr:site-specific DNA-methyltransferase [Salmonella enterica]ECN9376782.1 site-specific DNA-methyltransferase [Salmonella enterica subsp. enterica serovar Corvallis]EBR7620662.1 site-specific DNA-methyltransferase [Salmonella enterica]EBU2868062.1 site-specific DNA-methyltransferase [Salmonella enterica]ECY2307162.1 site-specific DNA-methyltransferase [Salmonella enterica]